MKNENAAATLALGVGAGVLVWYVTRWLSGTDDKDATPGAPMPSKGLHPGAAGATSGAGAARAGMGAATSASSPPPPPIAAPVDPYAPLLAPVDPYAAPMEPVDPYAAAPAPATASAPAATPAPPPPTAKPQGPCALRLDEDGLTAEGQPVDIPGAVARCKVAGRAELVFTTRGPAQVYLDLNEALRVAGVPVSIRVP